MISALMELALSPASGRHRTVADAADRWSVYSFSELDIEAYPDPVQPMVEVLTLPNGLSAEEVETAGDGAARVRSGRDAQSRGDALDLAVRALRHPLLLRLGQRLLLGPHRDHQPARHSSRCRKALRAGISPENPIGEIYRYTVESPDHDLIKEKEIEDWVLEKQLKTVPGVIDVSGFGGLTKEYHVDVDPQKLAYYQHPAGDADQRDAELQHQRRRQLPRRRRAGLRRARHRLHPTRSTTFATSCWRPTSRLPITVANVADVEVGYAPRLGIVGMNNRNEVVDRHRADAQVRQHAQDAARRGGQGRTSSTARASCRTGYKVVPYYDRTELVETTLHTVFENLTIGMALVFLVLIFFLGNLRSAIIAAINIPLALLRRVHPDARRRTRRPT